MSYLVMGITAAVILILLISAIWIFFFKTKNCSTQECFNSAMSSCKKASYLHEEQNASWQYNVRGWHDDGCTINVKILQAKKGTVELEKIEGLEMDCQVPSGFVGSPQSDLGKCTGKLKEGMQDLIIKKMHAYIMNNIGQVAEELSKTV